MLRKIILLEEEAHNIKFFKVRRTLTGIIKAIKSGLTVIETPLDPYIIDRGDFDKNYKHLRVKENINYVEKILDLIDFIQENNLNKPKNKNQLLNDIAEKVCEWMSLPKVAIYLYDEDKNKLFVKATSSNPERYPQYYINFLTAVGKIFKISTINLKPKKGPKGSILLSLESGTHYYEEDNDHPSVPVNKRIETTLARMVDPPDPKISKNAGVGIPFRKKNSDKSIGIACMSLEDSDKSNIEEKLPFLYAFGELAACILDEKTTIEIKTKEITMALNNLLNAKLEEERNNLIQKINENITINNENMRNLEEIKLQKEILDAREKELEQKRKELFETKTELTKEKQEKEKFSKELDALRDNIENNLEIGGIMHDTINNFDRIKSLANKIHRGLAEKDPNITELIELANKQNTLVQEAMTTMMVSQKEIKGIKTKDTVFYSLSKTQGKVARKYERDYLVPYNITFDITPNEEADMLPLGVVMLSRFIENLFLNSFRILANYETAEPKKISIYSEEKSLKLGEEAREPQKYIVVHFIDNGPGIPQERKGKIFQSGGDSTKEDTQGEHGVALPYMRKKMKEIGGYVREVGVPGEGAHFELFFPKLSPAELKEGVRKNPGKARLTHDLSNARILILDDHSEILDKYVSIYSKFGSEIKTGLNGKEGLDIIDSGFTPDFIQSDIEMDLMRGEDFIKEVRQRGHKMPIMVVTGNEEYIDEDTGDLNEDKGMDLLELGVNDIIIRDKAEEKIILEKAQNLLVRYLFKN